LKTRGQNQGKHGEGEIEQWNEQSEDDQVKTVETSGGEQVKTDGDSSKCEIPQVRTARCSTSWA
jgi:hypothetical protein